VSYAVEVPLGVVYSEAVLKKRKEVTETARASRVTRGRAFSFMPPQSRFAWQNKRAKKGENGEKDLKSKFSTHPDFPVLG
jgi:hypothetical protein